MSQTAPQDYLQQALLAGDARRAAGQFKLLRDGLTFRSENERGANSFFLLEPGEPAPPDRLLPPEEREPNVPAEYGFHMIAQWFCNCLAINGLVKLSIDGAEGERRGARALLLMLRQVCPKVLQECLHALAGGADRALASKAKSLLEEVQEGYFHEQLSCCLTEIIRNKLLKVFGVPEPSKACCVWTQASIRLGGTGNDSLDLASKAKIVSGLDSGDDDLVIQGILDALNAR